MSHKKAQKAHKAQNELLRLALELTQHNPSTVVQPTHFKNHLTLPSQKAFCAFLWLKPWPKVARIRTSHFLCLHTGD
jgi:hypothetical protein